MTGNKIDKASFVRARIANPRQRGYPALQPHFLKELPKKSPARWPGRSHPLVGGAARA